MRVEVAYALPNEQTLCALDLASGATVADALTAVAQQPAFANVDLATASVGIYGRVCSHSEALQDGDRVEVYRPLLMDAKTARLKRAQEQAKLSKG